MKILISGASGLIGTQLIPTLKAKGHEIFRLVRKTPRGADEIEWDAQQGFSEAEQAKLENFDAVIHLAGDHIASENWSEDKKRRIRESRLLGTRVLVEALKKTKESPRIFISASGEGFYGDRGDELLTEESPKGEGFLPDLCGEWEGEAQQAEEFGARVVILRLGVVLAKEGGALERMLPPFKFGVGGRLGSGRQYMSWIALDDLLRIFHFVLENPELKGPVNTTAPNPLPNAEFAATLGKVLHRPSFLAVPEFAIKLMFGEMGENVLLRGTRVVPRKLLDAGFEFEFENLENTMKHILK